MGERLSPMIEHFKWLPACLLAVFVVEGVNNYVRAVHRLH